MVQIAEAIDSARFLLSRVRNSMALGGQKEAVESQSPNVRKLEGILSQFPSYTAFRAKNIIHPDAAPFFEKYYTQSTYNGRVVNADFLYNSALTPGVQEFIRVR